MKKIAIILVGLLIVMSFNCKKEAPLPKTDEAKKETQTPPPGPKAKKVVLVINEMKFTNEDFQQFLRFRYPDILESAENPTVKPGNSILSHLFDSFLEHSMVLYAANQHDIPVDTPEMDQYIKKLDIPADKIDKATIANAIKVQKFLYSKVYEAVEVSDREIRDYYDAHIEDFRKKSEVFLYQILVNNRETAVSIRAMLDNNPQKFEEIARSESVSMDASKGGEMGFFEEGSLPKDMEQVVFSLAPGTISPVVESAYGFHIFKITQKKKGRLLFLDKVKPEVKQKVLSEKLRKAYRDFLIEMGREAAINVRYNELYFDYQNLKGEKEDENKQTTDSNNLSNPSG